MLFINSAAILALVAAVSAQTAAPFSNSSTPTNSSTSSTKSSSVAVSTSTATPVTLTVGGKTWKSLGCAANSLNFVGFELSSSSASNSHEKCLGECVNFEFAGLSGSSCYCSNRSDNATVIKSDSSCNTPCPGNNKQACGGSAAVARRAVPAGSLLTLFQAAAPSVTVLVGVYTTIVATQYVSICPTGPVTVNYSATLTLAHCGCTNVTPVATIPFSTTVASCGCGPNGAMQTYTVSYPAVKTSGSTSATAVTSSPSTKYTGAGNSIKAGSVLGAVGAIVALVL
jgi:hypothetical protein